MRRRRSLRMMLFAPLAVLSAIACGSGCQKALFKEKDPRTQFETYDRMRDRYVPTETYDVFGNPRPALRERLARD